jgi:hypothetical protein
MCAREAGITKCSFGVFHAQIKQFFKNHSQHQKYVWNTKHFLIHISTATVMELYIHLTGQI